jgi:hypothetical protein
MNDLHHPCEPWTERISLAAAGCLPPDEEQTVRGHIEVCPACRKRFRQLTELCGALGQLRSPVGDEEMAVVERAMAAVAAGKPQRSAAGRIRRAFRRRPREIRGPIARTRRPFDGRWIMRHPISLASAAVFLLVIAGVALWFHGGGTTPALADFIKPILEAKTVKFKMVVEREGEYRETSEVTMSGLSLERTDRITMEAMVRPSAAAHPGSRADGIKWLTVPYKKVQIWDYAAGKSIVLSPNSKVAVVITFVNLSGKNSTFNVFVLDLRRQLREFRDGRQFRRESLGEKEIQGRRAVGYRLTGHAMVADLWGDPKTGEPISVAVIQLGFPKGKSLLSNFVFDAHVAPSLFSLEPPPGYKVVTITRDASPATEGDLVETFRRYSESSGGSFPDALDFFAMARLFSEQQAKPKPHLSAQEGERQWLDHNQEAERFRRGSSFVLGQLPPEADPHYAGKGVKRGAADRPIFWYRPKDTKKYRVIYADLSIRESDTPPHVPGAQAVLAPLTLTK